MPLNNTGQILRFWLRQNDGVSEGKAVHLSKTGYSATCEDAGLSKYAVLHCGEARSENREAHPGDQIHLRGCRAQASLQAETWLPRWMEAWNLCGIGGCVLVTRLGISRKQCATVAPRDF